MLVVPAVDVLAGAATRLSRGDYDQVVVQADLSELLDELSASRPPMLHLVDLDGARDGRFDLGLLDVVAAACPGIPVQASGGIRDLAAANAALERGATRVVLGTAALCGEADLAGLVAALGGRLVVALDVRADRIAVRGWREVLDLTLDAALDRCRDSGVERVLVTAADRDGTLGGPDLELMRRVTGSGLAVLAAGGIRGDEDLDALEKVGCEAAIVGRAWFAGWRPWSGAKRGASSPAGGP